MKPGRICPTDYHIGPEVFRRDPDFVAETLYVVGGLYGNAFALDAIEAMAAAEPGPVTIVVNGDAHWFDAELHAFRSLDVRLARYPAICGNVELELARTADIGAGCGCAYPDNVDDGVVQRSNAIIATLATEIFGERDIKARFAALPKTLIVEVGSAKVTVVHGDAWSVAGWRFAREALDAPGASAEISLLRRKTEADVFASTHTCEAVMRRFSTTSGATVIANNGAAGMSNFGGDRRGVITRIGRAVGPVKALYNTLVKGVFVEAIPVDYDHAGFVRQFDSTWTAGSPAAISYRNRIVNGADMTFRLQTQMRTFASPAQS